MDTRDGVAKDENSNVSNEMITLAGDALEPLRCSSGHPTTPTTPAGRFAPLFPATINFASSRFRFCCLTLDSRTKAPRFPRALLCDCPGENPKVFPRAAQIVIASSARPYWDMSTAQSVISAGPLIRTLGLYFLRRASDAFLVVRKPVCFAVGVFVAPQAPRTIRKS
jgi:hypothetical protein